MQAEACGAAPEAARDADLILVGGGLANGLIAWRLRALRPQLRLLLLEAGPTLGGNHTWSFHATDLTGPQRAWLAPLVARHWNGHEVIFPQRRRRLEGGYASISTSRFHEQLSATLGPRARCGVPVAALTPTEVTLADGCVLRARAVIDGRGPRPSASVVLGHQKFLGQELRLAAPHGLERPVLMDASVDQHDGYRFVYLLPFSADTLLVEDTYYADGGELDVQALRGRIARYAAERGWQVRDLLREEQGVLPIVLSGDVQAFWREAGGVPSSGLSAGLFHPTTGYSLPDAVALAELVAAQPDLSAAALFDAIRRHAVGCWQARGFFRLLNRMLFRSAPPTLRWKVMQRFYGLPEPLIARFYAARLQPLDKLRIVAGKPPVPLGAALRAALDRPSARAEVQQ
ncbi:lycopene beta-cyclase CrtY [Azohydromonas caseinilytica]|uniref:Lycopene beta-cyclase CrtY n=1 Tax=Azohydromonas caseinilytica TaxID=2728836 RepID=A0A848FCZ3_9BURK|nr:lycopene beta-cyclase CrtY [Azohydromonas caseinilytica]NML16856.1 lycopene beta-cyclase CrtY [Azohydromonas caseinilytica]